MKNLDVKTNIEVSGVIMSEDLLNRLREFQRHNNETIKEVRDNVADAICFIGKNLDRTNSSDAKELQDLITNLSYIRDYFNDFRKP